MDPPSQTLPHHNFLLTQCGGSTCRSIVACVHCTHVVAICPCLKTCNSYDHYISRDYNHDVFIPQTMTQTKSWVDPVKRMLTVMGNCKSFLAIRFFFDPLFRLLFVQKTRVPDLSSTVIGKTFLPVVRVFTLLDDCA